MFGRETCVLSSLEKTKIRILKVEDRAKDSWVDMGLRQLREGEVRFYRVSDPLTGEWLFKVCSDEEMHRATVKALKCPPGEGFAQIEGDTMLFQQSLVKDCYYDIISLSYMDEERRLRRHVIAKDEEVPVIIKANFKVVPYEEATDKKAIGKRLATLCETKDGKEMILLFLFERAWPISEIRVDLATKKVDLLKLIKDAEKASIEEVYQSAAEQYDLAKDDVDSILRLLETEGKITKLNGYVKTKR